MKQFRPHAICRAALLAAAAFGSTGAFAVSLSNLTITSFGVTASAGTVTWLGSEYYRTFDAQAASAGGIAAFDESSWSGSDNSDVSGAAVTSTATGAYSSPSSTTATLLSLSSTAVASAPALFVQPNASFALATQSGAFSLSQAGIVTFNVGYTLNLSTFAGSLESAYAMAAIDVGNYTTGLDQAANISYSSSLLPTGSGTFSGILTVKVTMASASDFGFYTLDGRTDASALALAPVPEPETWAMLSVGLLVVSTLLARRRRSGSSVTS